jgi:hypothetical protein
MGQAPSNRYTVSAMVRSTAIGWVAALAALLGVTTAACGSTPTVALREGPREYVAADYDAILKRWTRAERLYAFQGIDDVLSVSSTFESWDFRWAYVIRYAEDYRLTIEQRRELLANALQDARRHHQFFVSLYGNKPAEADLTKASPAWVVRLLDDKGHVTAPEEILPIKKPTVLERTYFPYATVWRQSFRVRFPSHTSAGPSIDPEAGLVTLRFSGPLGNLELQWTQASR